MSEKTVNEDAGQSESYRPVFMVGAFPPPVHGMGAVNTIVREQLIEAGVELTVIDVAAKGLKRSPAARFARVATVLRGLGVFLCSDGRREATLYMSISGGIGQFYDVCFVALARLTRMRVYLHHHSFAYLDKRNWLTHLLIRMSGLVATHITQSPGMAKCLRDHYSPVHHVVPVSNAVFLVAESSKGNVRHFSLQTIGFISNISKEKGIFEFLDLVAAYEREGLQLSAKCAGPFQDTETETLVRQRIGELSTVEYVGPKIFGR